MVPILVSTAVSVQQTISLTNDDWQTATTYVMNRSSAEDGIAFRPSYLRTPFDYYRRRSARVSESPTPVIPAEPWTSPIVQDWPEVAPSVVESSLHDGERLWLVTLPNLTEDAGDLRAGRSTPCFVVPAKPLSGSADNRVPASASGASRQLLKEKRSGVPGGSDFERPGHHRARGGHGGS